MTAIDTSISDIEFNSTNDFGDLTLAGVDWTVAAACRTVPNADELFFSDDFADIGVAKLTCAQCPVIAQCLEEAFDRGEPWGVWGGQLFEDGRIVTIKRRRGRPPKTPRPEDLIPMIPIPEHLVELVA